MNYTLLMELVSEIGCRIAVGGGETYRVEESVNRILTAYGVESRVYSVPNSLIITILIPGQAPMTQLCRMERKGTDLDAVEQYSNLGRRICTQIPDLETAMQWVKETEKKRKQYKLPTLLLGYVLVAWGFSIFFGGGMMDSACAAACGFLLGVAEYFMGKLQTNVFFQNIAAAFVLAFFAYGMSELGIVPNADASVIGTLMLLVPGALFTNAMRDIIFGDTNSGVSRVVEALLIAVAVALGTAAAWNLNVSLGGLPQQVDAIAHSPAITCFVSFVACAGFVIVFNVHGYGSILCALGGAITWGAYCIASALGCHMLMCCFAASCVAAAFSEIMARVRKYPAISYLLISLLPLIPGAGIYYAAQQAIRGNMDLAADYGLETLSTAGVMAAGILVVSTAVRMWTTHKRNKESLQKKE
ncbi:MAG: threonine/serine exporter family protein [Ruminococcaceae bacterium]|nr:threonine/serine exporter family protein [Oscillospiraceae bacterium]